MKFGLQLGLQTTWPSASGGLSNDTSLSEFTIDSEDVLLLSNIQRGNGVTEVPVTAVPTHPGATRTINTSADPDPVAVALSTGDNTVTVTVTAEDGVTTQDHVVTVRRLTAGVQEVTFINFASAPLFNGSAADGVILSNASARIGFWAQSGPQTQPDWSAYGVTNYVEVSLDSGAYYPANISVIGVAIGANGFTVVDTNSGTLLVTDPTPGARQDAEFSPGLSSAGAYVTVTQQGANPS